MGLSTFRWIVVDDDETETVCAETIQEVVDQIDTCQPNAIIRVGFAEWNNEKQEYE